MIRPFELITLNDLFLPRLPGDISQPRRLASGWGLVADGAGGQVGWLRRCSGVAFAAALNDVAGRLR